MKNPHASAAQTDIAGDFAMSLAPSRHRGLQALVWQTCKDPNENL
jgi:hypothetical protein